MKRINVFTPASDHYDERRSAVEVIVPNRDTKRETRYTEQDVRPVSGIMDDRELSAKFERNAAHLLSQQEVGQALKTILSLDELENVSHLMGYFTR